jgi:hypothetical protein
VWKNSSKTKELLWKWQLGSDESWGQHQITRHRIRICLYQLFFSPEGFVLAQVYLQQNKKKAEAKGKKCHAVKYFFFLNNARRTTIWINKWS